ncbi:MAG: acyl-CoA dehydrogenase, partial [Oceanospirillaceae bacterium]|nr:acyl-CoA dehydrogenase [Oceanospirillaceae bacterium]
YEGTNGIQALDLLGRKVIGSRGDLLEHFVGQANAFIDEQINDPAMAEFIVPLQVNLQRWVELTHGIVARNQRNADELGAASFDYLMYAGYTVLAYIWARSAAVARQKLAADNGDAAFYRTKLTTARFYFQRLLPRNEGLAQSISAGAETLMALEDEAF